MIFYLCDSYNCYNNYKVDEFFVGFYGVFDVGIGYIDCGSIIFVVFLLYYIKYLCFVVI